MDSHPELERLADAPSNVVCFRFNAGEREVEGEVCDLWLNQLNREILIRVQETGFAMPSATTLGDRYAIRVAITNHRTTLADIDALVNEVVHLGRTMRAGGRMLLTVGGDRESALRALHSMQRLKNLRQRADTFQ